MSDGDSHWLTYRELATAWGISLAAAEARARRQIRAGHWRHRLDNEGKRAGRVLVPAADLQTMRQGAQGLASPVPQGLAQPLAPGESQGSTAEGQDALLAELRHRAEAAEADRDRERAERQRVEAERDRLAAEVIPERERRARVEGENAGLRETLQRADLAAAEAGRREAAAVQALQQAQGRAEAERVARQAAEVGRDVAQAAAQASERRWEAAEALLASRSTGNPLTRAWHRFWQDRK